jgi:hypothetical protein
MGKLVVATVLAIELLWLAAITYGVVQLVRIS